MCFDGVRVWWCRVGVHGLCHVNVCVTQHGKTDRKLFLDSVGGGAWPLHHTTPHTACTHNTTPTQYNITWRKTERGEDEVEEKR